MLIGDAIPAWYTAPYKYSWAMDYGHDEVRQRKLDIIKEICTRYDVDGFEMDFLRHPFYFRKGHEADGAKKMSAFVESVRKQLDDIGDKKGKRLRLLVRVPPQLAECKRIGLHVPTWMRNDWVDMVIATLDPIELTIKAGGARNLRVKVNDRDLTPTEQADSWLVFKSAPMVQGRNKIDLRLHDDSTDAKPRVTEIDVWVRYR